MPNFPFESLKFTKGAMSRGAIRLEFESCDLSEGSDEWSGVVDELVFSSVAIEGDSWASLAGTTQRQEGNGGDCTVCVCGCHIPVDLKAISFLEYQDGTMLVDLEMLFDFEFEAVSDSATFHLRVPLQLRGPGPTPGALRIENGQRRLEPYMRDEAGFVQLGKESGESDEEICEFIIDSAGSNLPKSLILQLIAFYEEDNQGFRSEMERIEGMEIDDEEEELDDEFWCEEPL